jgi:glycosyltransferase involved in cell wall biosynthesis
MGLTTVHITNAYHPTSGGIRTFYTALLDAGNVAGRRVVLVVPGARTATQEIGRFGRIYHVRAPLAPAFDRRYRMIMPQAYLPGCPSALVDILARERPDLVEMSDKYSLPYLAAMLRKRWHRRAGRPVLVGLSCERFDDNMAAYLSRSRAARAFTRWYIRHVYGPPFDAHIAVSEYTAAELRGALHDRGPGFIRTCTMGVDAMGFGPSRRSAVVRRGLLSAAGGDERSVLLFYAGRLSPEKNVELLVAALRELVAGGGDDYRLVVAGDGPSADWLRARAVGSLEGRIFLCGNLDRDTLAQYNASCDVFVHPNPREPFGIGPLEAMASGVAVVLPDAGGVLEYASSANAWLAAPTGPAFAKAIRAARRGDPQRRTAALATAEQFGWRQATRRYFDAYDDIHRRFHEAPGAASQVRWGPARGAPRSRSTPSPAPE